MAEDGDSERRQWKLNAVRRWEEKVKGGGFSIFFSSSHFFLKKMILK